MPIMSRDMTALRTTARLIMLIPLLIAIAFLTSSAWGITLQGRWLTFHASPDTCITISSKWDEIDTIRIVYDTNRSLATSDTLTSFSGRRRHHAELNGLEPSTRYYYKIQDDNGNSHTDIDSFKTAGPLGTQATLNLLMFSNPEPNALSTGQEKRDALRGWIDTVRTQIATGRCPYPDLILSIGDFVEAATSANWDTMFTIMDSLFELAPLIPVIGDHDGLSKAKSDSSAYTYYFNLPRSGLGAQWAGDHQYVLDYQNMRFISFSLCSPSRSQSQDKVVAGSLQYNWLTSLLANTPVEIQHIIELHHVNLIPLPWNLQNGATSNYKMTWQIGIYNDSTAVSTNCDTLRYEYYRDIRPLLEGAHAISIEGHAWFSAATTPLASSIYWGGAPVILSAGGGGHGSGINPKRSFCMMYLSQSQVRVDYHKVGDWPGAAEVSAGYPWQAAASNRIFTIYDSGDTLDMRITPQVDLAVNMNLAWQDIPGAVQYYVYKALNPWLINRVLIDSTTYPQYIDLGAVGENPSYFYTVTADPDGGLAPLRP
jgi:hypothetical protein